MYTNFFGLNEKPFSITPDPRYLFLSERHAEALAHLLYGVTESGGFIQLTGEVGTGKTTIVRSLLEQMPADTRVALVLNPRLTPHEFLLAICEELRLPLSLEQRGSMKAIVDALNQRLLDAHAEGQRVVLIVDEAQNLSPDVLEQIRLLTNLETAKQKLLQIILIGQPELRHLLARTDLRQLAQRITGRYHLEPLDRAETQAYIAHRLRVAGGGAEIFTAPAAKAIHRAAHGIPRLINVICDRALLGAFSRERPRVNRSLARHAVNEVSGEDRRPWRPWLITAGLVFALAGLGLAWWQLSPKLMPAEPPMAKSAEPANTSAGGLSTSAAAMPAAKTGAGETQPVLAAAPTQDAQVSQPPLEGPLQEPLPAQDPEPVAPRLSFAQQLSEAGAATGTDAAFSALLETWGLSYAPSPGSGRPCDVAVAAGLRCLFQQGTWGQILNLDRPVIMSLVNNEGQQHQIVLRSVTAGGDAEVIVGTRRLTVGLGELMPLWLGDFLLVWRPAFGSGRVLSEGTQGADVAALRLALSEALDLPLISPQPAIFDADLKQAVVLFQRQQRLEPDGVAGARTMIALNSVLALPDRPHLDQEG